MVFLMEHPQERRLQRKQNTSTTRWQIYNLDEGAVDVTHVRSNVLAGLHVMDAFLRAMSIVHTFREIAKLRLRKGKQ
jgi:6-phosphogluconolactonase/glucosamine-6-phosphate isomerase/deaminase